jgi:hypothetical protein
MTADDILLNADDAGAVRYSERQGPSPRGWAFVAVILAAVYGLLLPLVGGHPLDAFVAWMGAVIFLGALVLFSLLNRIEVRDRAVAVHLDFWHTQPYLIPLISIDPASVRLHYHANLLGRRLPGTNGTRVARMTAFLTVAVSLRGLRPHLAHPRLRKLASGRFEIEEHFKYLNAPPLDLAPYAKRWIIGTKHPERLLAALEKALVDAGVTGAVGLAERELSAPRIEHLRRDPNDVEGL